MRASLPDGRFEPTGRLGAFARESILTMTSVFTHPGITTGLSERLAQSGLFNSGWTSNQPQAMGLFTGNFFPQTFLDPTTRLSRRRSSSVNHISELMEARGRAKGDFAPRSCLACLITLYETRLVHDGHAIAHMRGHWSLRKPTSTHKPESTSQQDAVRFAHPRPERTLMTVGSEPLMLATSSPPATLHAFAQYARLYSCHRIKSSWPIG